MYGEFSLYGVYIPTLMGLVVIAYALKSVACFALARVNFYRWVWHPALFNLAVYVVSLSALFSLMRWMQ